MWEPFNFFVGGWKGSRKGEQDQSRAERKSEFLLNECFVFVQNKSIFSSQEKNPNGEIHKDWGIISYDRARETYVFRQFYIEGFVNQYLLKSIAEGGQSISFVTEEIENISPSWQAKESYRIIGPDEFVEVFEVASQGKEFEIYSENRFQRVRSE